MADAATPEAVVTHDTTKKASGTRSNSPSKQQPRPIINATLAAMLRESASFVEKGEFDPILYQALQDFRSYYKQHYPIKKREKHNPIKKREKQDSKRQRDKSKVVAVDPPVVHKATDIADTSTTTGATESFDGTVATDTATTTGSESPKVEALPHRPPSPSAISSRESSIRSDYFEQEHSERTLPPPTIPAATVSPQVGRPLPASPQVMKPNATAAATASASASPSQPKQNNLFASFKFPKLHVNPAFTAFPKMIAQRVKVDLEELTDGGLTGELAQQAQSSVRRRAPADVAPASAPAAVAVVAASQNSRAGEPGWCDQHFTMNCPCKATTAPKLPYARADPILHDTTTATQLASGYSLQTVDAKPSPSTSQVDRPRSIENNDSKNSSNAHAGSTAELSETSSNRPIDSQATAKHTIIQKVDFPTMQHEHVKPDFQRPVNKTSSLIANGWIEQQRRSKMRFVWKEVLASLVHGSKPGEETTLWIQRETINPVTGKKELEALHQVPVKLLEKVTYLDYTADNRFTFKLYNAAEEFIFRCNTDVAAMNWVMTLKKFEELSKATTGLEPSSSQQTQKDNIATITISNQMSSFEDEKKGPEPTLAEPVRLTVRELRAVCHGAGVNTAGMERCELEAAAEEVRKQGTFFAPPPHRAAHQQPIPNVVPQTAAAPPPTQTAPPPTQSAPPQQAPPTSTSDRDPFAQVKLSIKDLRATCHGAGINTAGMERSELEAAADEVIKRGTYFERPAAAARMPATAPSSQEDLRKHEELRARQEELQKHEELRARQEELRKHEESRARQDELRRQQEVEGKQRRETEEARRRQIEEERRRLETEARRRQAEEEHRRRMAEEEHRRRMAEQQADEQRRRYTEQQAQWEKQQQDDESRRRVAEQQATEQRRRRDEAIRKQQQWGAQQQWQQQQQQAQTQQHWSQQQKQQWQQQQAQQPQQPPRQPQQFWQQQPGYQPQPQQQTRQQTPPPQHAQQNQQQHPSAVNEKYANMACQTQDDGQAIITRIKHDVLIKWALQPPQLQSLRTIDVLVTTIHSVFPPALGVPAHAYFGKWNALNRNDLLNAAGLTDEDKLKKAVKRIRFFLHPDKLPNDLNAEQSFMVKMLWDVTSDAWEEFEKRKEDLDWIK